MRNAVAGASVPASVACESDDEGFVTVPTRVANLVRGALDVRRAAGNAYVDESFVLDDVDELAEGEAVRVALRGGFWNATDPGRVGEGITHADVTALRASLLAIGVRVSHDDADGLLCAAERGALRTLWEAQGRTGTDPDDARTRERILAEKREASAARRARARALGFCIVCTKARCDEGNATCDGCQEAANVRLVARRKKAARRKAAAAARAARKPAKANAR